jgi:ferredoxin-NADP reductase/predicted pyridoxine 5'-phosphate oxidase superfamily flavin-nucleotide-binding protein
MENAMSTQDRTSSSPFHEGERMVQARLGVGAIEEWARQVIRPYLPEQHRAFHTAQPFLIAAARDGDGRPWATVLSGPEGFITSPDPRALTINARPPAGDPLEVTIGPGADIGLLGIELASRRRNRVNGTIRGSQGDGSGVMIFDVGQSFGNCPQYITPRRWRRIDDHHPGKPGTSSLLTAAQREWIAGADTFFIASGHRGTGDAAGFGMDASHRGGEPGFVTVMNETQLIFPDYAGNNHYNTIGNLVVDPRVGLLFVDFRSGSMLQLTGRARIDWDSEAVAGTPGAHRLVTVDIEAIVELQDALPLRWETEAEAVRTLRVVEKITESADVTSFILEARDQGELPSFRAGQHLPIEITEVEQPAPIRRTYSLSGPPSVAQYRISVKRDPRGLASKYLHDRIEVGDFINAGKPAGDFVIPDETSPMVLISAGVGITPMVTMLHDLASKKNNRDILFLHGAIDGDHLPLAAEIQRVAQGSKGIRVHTALSRPSKKDRIDGEERSMGRINGALLRRLGVDTNAHYMICGPLGFMASLQSELLSLGVPENHIHIETFGPTGNQDPRPVSLG